MSGKRVLCVIDNLGSGGAQRQIVNLAIGLSRLGHTVELFTYATTPGHFSDDIEQAGIRANNCSRDWAHPWSTIVRLRGLFSEQRFDTAIAFLPMPSFIACLALSGNRTVRLVLSERSSFRLGVPSRTDRWVRSFHGRATWVTTNSHHQAKLMRSAFPRLQDRLVTIYNGFDLKQFRTRQFSRSTGALRFVAVGRINGGKNIENLVEAISRVRGCGFDLRLDWIGRLDHERWSSGYYEGLSARIDQSGIGKAWRWLGERSDVASRLGDYDALVHPSYYEGLPNAICESFACGLPVLASNVCDHPLLLDAPRRGLLFDPNDPASIADAIQSFAALGAAQRHSIGSAARRYAEESLAQDRMCAAYHALI